MNIDRMRIVERVLVRVIEERLPFDMDEWVECAGSSDSCETAACAAGWTARDPEAQEEGLCILYGAPCYGKQLGTQAMRCWLDIHYLEAERLFMPDSYCVDWVDGEPPRITPQMVLERVREMLE